MSITYEEALSTLNSMFSVPWTEDHLDTVLRHFEGHMENTVDAVLSHGDGTPQQLLDKLSNSKVGPDQIEQDAELAKKIALEQRQPTGNGGRDTPNNTPRTITSPQTSVKKGRGLSTHLPDDFLRIPGQEINAIEDDGALARMLQDKLFAEELKNNPEFAHLARGSSRAQGTRGLGGNVQVGLQGAASHREYPGMNRVQNQQQGPGVMDALSGMGENAKKRLQDLANRFKSKKDPAENYGGERRGLLDTNEQEEVSFARKNEDYEMRSMPSGAGKKID